jgi:glycosyltransferase involved in cell wall biosynthesis
VVVPTFNRLNLLTATVDSLRRQSLEDCCFLLVDDGSESSVLEYIRSICATDSRFVLLQKPPHVQRGCQTSRNLGLESATSRYLMFLDSDDLLTPRCLQERVAFADAKETADIIVGNQAIFDELQGTGAWVNHERTDRTPIERFLRIANAIDVPWVNGGCIFRTGPLQQSKVRWRPEFLWDDLAFHAECLFNGLIPAWMPRGNNPDAWYRKHGGEHFGARLNSPEGRRNTFSLLLLLARLAANDAEHANLCRDLLSDAVFHRCILPELSSGDFRNAREILRKSRTDSLFISKHWQWIDLFINLRHLFYKRNRLTYYTNQLARSYTLKRAFESTPAAYGLEPVSVQQLAQIPMSH